MSFPFSGAAWIGSSIVGGAHAMVPAPYFRKEWRADRPVEMARLFVTALGLYEFEINGKIVGDQIFAPGWTDYKHRVQYQVHNVTALLRKGENAMGAVLGDGWYCGYLAWLPRQFYGDRPRLLARLEIEFKDGTTKSIVTDGTWKTATGPIVQNDMIMGESYDARLELGAWSSPGYDEAAWTSALIMPEHRAPLVISQGPPVRRIEEKRFAKPVLRGTFGDLVRIYDLGQNLSGRAQLKVKAPRGTVVTIRFAEMLNKDGTLNTQSLRRARATDYYTCKGEGMETWEPRFTFHGFRYAEVTGVPKEYPVELTGIVLHSDMATTGHFACSHPLVNQLQSNIVWSQRSNFLEVPTDCPQRDERMGWTGDAQIFVRTAAFNMDVRKFFYKWMQDVRDIQAPEGGINCTAPDVNPKPGDCGPGWGDAIFICPWTIYLCYGDKQILADNYEAMRRYLELFMRGHRCKGHIRAHADVDAWGGHGDWLALDGSGSAEGCTPKDLIGTAYYAHGADITSRVAEILGHKKEAAKYRQLHKEIVAAFRHRFVTAEGLVVGGTQTSYVMALKFDLLPEKQRLVAAKELARLIERRGMHLATGFLGTPYILDVLEENGQLDIAYKLLEQETFPSWLFPIKNGATTIWERWDGWTLEKGFNEESMSSFNHYAYGAVGAWMVRSVAGLDLDPEKPGYKHIIFRPQPGGTITWAEAELETPQGKTSIHWKKTKSGLELELVVPKGSTATLMPPAGYGVSKTLRAGKHRVMLKKKID